MKLSRRNKHSLMSLIILSVVILPFQNCGKFQADQKAITPTSSSTSASTSPGGSNGSSSSPSPAPVAGPAPSPSPAPMPGPAPAPSAEAIKHTACSALLGTPTISLSNTSVLNFNSGLSANTGDRTDLTFNDVFTTTGSKGFTDMAQVNSLGCNYLSVVESTVVYNSTQKSDIDFSLDLMGLVKKTSDATNDTDAKRASFAQRSIDDFTELPTSAKNNAYPVENGNALNINSYNRNLVVKLRRNAAQGPIRCVNGTVWVSLVTKTTVAHGAQTPLIKQSAPIFARINLTNSCPQETKMYLDGSNGSLTTKGALLGSAVATSGNWAVALAPSQDFVVKGAGAAIVYRNTALPGNTPVWVFSETLKNNSALAGDNFSAVAIDGSYMAISSEFRSGTGVVFIYKLSGTNWSLIQTITPSDSESGQIFGHSLALKGTRLAIGSPHSSLVPGGGELSGAVSLYEFNALSNVFEFRNRISHPGQSGEGLGMSLSIDNNLLAIGAPQALLTQSLGKGKAYIYNISSLTSPTQLKVIPAHADVVNNGAEFGASISLLGNALAIGAPGTNTGALAAGMAFYYTDYNTALKSKFSGTTTSANLGNSLVLTSGGLFVGVPKGNPPDTGATSGGYVDHYSLTTINSGGLNSPIAGSSVAFRYFSTQVNSNDYFGYSIGVNGQSLIVGAYNKPDPNAGSGAAFIYVK